MTSLYEKMSQDRKAAQKEGTTPPWMTTGGFQMYREKLAYKGETYSQAVSRMSEEAARHAVKIDNEGRREHELYLRFSDILWAGWLAPSTPVLANLGTKRGLPVSCSGSYIPDSISGFYQGFHEAAMLTKTGHGCSCYLGDIRPRGTPYMDGEGRSDGVMPVIAQMLGTVGHVSQGATRRGATAFYIPMSHGDVREVLDFHIANPKRLQIGYIFTDAFIERLDAGEAYALALWRRFMKVRAQSGKAYMVFPDKANRHAEELGICFDSPILASNLCTEIFLPSNENETFSCVLSSINVYKYDEWKDDELFIHDCVLFLNAVVDSYLERLDDYEGTERIKAFTEKYRALGLGALGFCSYLQRSSIPLESFAAADFNEKFFSELYGQARRAGDHYGNYTVLAVAPNVSSALVAGGVSQGIEPFTANVFTQETAAGDVYRMNPDLLALMKSKHIDTEENIKKIKEDLGSIQGNPLFTEHEQQVFKTAYEVDQSWLVRLANDRGSRIDQGQSLNLFFPDDADEEWVSEVHKLACTLPYVKSVYYFNTAVGVQGSNGACMMCES